MSSDNPPTEQGGYKVGNKRPPKERQFGQPNGNPRHNGAWKKEDTARYKLEQMIKLTADELGAIVADNDAPLFEKKLAIAIKDGKWKELEGMMNQVYGQPKQPIEQTNIEAPKPLLDRRSNAKDNDPRQDPGAK